MVILSKLRGLVPPSSRSLHQLFAEVVEFHAAMRDLSRFCRDELGWLHGEVAQLRIDVDDARRKVHAHDAHAKMLLWQLYRHEGEGLDDARKRFFAALPKATGELRMLQLVSARLQRDFDAFCSEHDLDYWVISGTLLGAYRHGGFIPWDDDIDVGMLRSDVEKLMSAAAGDARFQVTDLFDYDFRCRQVRFRYRDELIPCFLDVFIFDLSSLPPQEAHAEMLSCRRAMFEEIGNDDSLAFWNSGNRFVDARTDAGALIRAYFDAAANTASSEGSGYLAGDASAAQSVVWGYENVDSFTGLPIVVPYDAIFPTRRMLFEGDGVAAPNNPECLLEATFGDYLELPDDLAFAHGHIPPEELHDERVMTALREFAAASE